MRKLLIGLGLFLFLLVWTSCKKEPDFPFHPKEEYLKHYDIHSELVVIIPDIQDYITLERRRYFLKTVMQWILMMKESGFTIKAVVQTGDVTNYNRREEWIAASQIFSALDGEVPYLLTTGNHDYGNGGLSDSRFTYFSEYFNNKKEAGIVSSFQNRLENSVLQINIHGRPFQIISLEFAPNDSIIAWANGIIKSDEDMSRMILTHAYLYQNQTRYDYSVFGLNQNDSPYSYPIASKEKINDGEEIWEKLIYPNKSVQFVICGHRLSPDNAGHLLAENAFGKRCYQLLFNVQDFPNGGDGWIQVIEFKKDTALFKVSTYSSYLNIWDADSLHQFQFNIN